MLPDVSVLPFPEFLSASETICTSSSTHWNVTLLWVVFMALNRDEVQDLGLVLGGGLGAAVACIDPVDPPHSVGGGGRGGFLDVDFFFLIVTGWSDAVLVAH